MASSIVLPTSVGENSQKKVACVFLLERRGRLNRSAEEWILSRKAGKSRRRVSASVAPRSFNAIFIRVSPRCEVCAFGSTNCSWQADRYCSSIVTCRLDAPALESPPLSLHAMVAYESCSNTFACPYRGIQPGPFPRHPMCHYQAVHCTIVGHDVCGDFNSQISIRPRVLFVLLLPSPKGNSTRLLQTIWLPKNSLKILRTTKLLRAKVNFPVHSQLHRRPRRPIRRSSMFSYPSRRTNRKSSNDWTGLSKRKEALDLKPHEPRIGNSSQSMSMLNSSAPSTKAQQALAS